MTPIKNQLLHRYWIEFEPADARQAMLTIYPEGVATKIPRGVGVTAFTVDDALFLTDEDLLSGVARPPIRRIVEDVELARLAEFALEAGLPGWLPGMDIRRATTIWRGIWFPFRGYRLSRA